MAPLRRRLPLKILVPLLAIAALSIASYAATVSVSTATYQEQNGVQYVVTGDFSATSNGFLVTQAAGTASTLPVTWNGGGTVQTALTAGNWEYSVTLTFNGPNPASTTTYAYTVQWNTGGGTVQLCQLTISVAPTTPTGTSMTMLCDAGASFNAPAGITITVA